MRVILLILIFLAACAPAPGLESAAPAGEPLAADAPAANGAVIGSGPAPNPTATPDTRPPAPTPSSTAVPDIRPPAPTLNPTATPDIRPPALSPTPGEKWILVRISEQRVYAYAGEVLVYEFPVSTGRNNNTAVGRFKVRDKRLNAVNVTWGYDMPHWMGVYWVNPDLENGFHALPVLPDGSRLWEDQIGAPASDGCIVLLPDDMAALYEWAEVGTPVVIEP